MTVQIVKLTGEMETVEMDELQEDGTYKKVPKEIEITEVVQEQDFHESHKAIMSKQAQLRAAMLSRDTGFRHVVKIL